MKKIILATFILTSVFLEAQTTLEVPYGASARIRGYLSFAESGVDSGMMRIGNINLLYWPDTNNFFSGWGAGNLSRTGNHVTAVGYVSGANLTTGGFNSLFGSNAGGAITDASHNTLIGYYAGANNNSGSYNTFVGSGSGYRATAVGNTAIGSNAYLGQSGANGTYNTAIGFESLYYAKSAQYNTAVGMYAANSDSSGSYNTAIGVESGFLNKSGSGNLFIGNKAGYSETGSNKLYIENSDADSANALIFGNFATDKLRINGTQQITSNTDSVYLSLIDTGQYDPVKIRFSNGTYDTYFGPVRGLDDYYAVSMGSTPTDTSILFFHGCGVGGMSITNGNIWANGLYNYHEEGYQKGNLVLDSDSNLWINADTVIFNDVNMIQYIDTFWDDLTVPATQARVGATSKPAYNYDTLGLLWDNTPLDTTNQLVILNYQIPHRWKTGTDLYLHVHYHQASAADTCEWFKAQYKFTDRGETRAPAYTTIYTNNQTVYTYSAGSLHQTASFPAISGSGHTASSMLQIVLYCKSDADLYTYDMDIHFEIDKPGSDSEIP